MPSATRATRSTRCESGFARSGGRFRTSTTKARARRVPGPPRSPRTSTSSTATCGSATRAPRTPTTWIRARTPPGCGRRSTPCWRARARAPGDRARRMLDQVEALKLTDRRRLVRVPASSANLGPGLRRSRRRDLAPPRARGRRGGRLLGRGGGRPVPLDRSNLCVRAFEALHPADGLRFTIRSEIPLARGLGSSAAAIVAGLMAADHLFELGLDRDDDLRAGGGAGGPP